MSLAADRQIRALVCAAIVLHTPACEEVVAGEPHARVQDAPVTRANARTPPRPERVLTCAGDVCTDRVTSCQYLRLILGEAVALVPRLRSHGTPWCAFTY